MDEKVAVLLEKKRNEIKEKNEKKKLETLISLGLYEKVYSPDDEKSDEYNLCEYNYKEEKNKYFKQVLCQVTDEEYEEIKKLCNTSSDIDSEDSNSVATALTVIAWIIFIGGFIAGIVFGNVEVESYYRDYTEFSFAIALIYWAVSLISGIMMLGFAEIIKLLNSIKSKK